MKPDRQCITPKGATKKNPNLECFTLKLFLNMLQLNLIGNLGANAQVVEANSSTFVSFSVAHTETFTTADNVKHERVTWVNVIVNWDCKNLLPYLVRGCKVFVSGSLALRTYQDKSGKWCAGINLRANSVVLCGGNFPHNSNLQNPITNNTDSNEQNISNSVNTRQGDPAKNIPANNDANTPF